MRLCPPAASTSEVARTSSIAVARAKDAGRQIEKFKIYGFALKHPTFPI